MNRNAANAATNITNPATITARWNPFMNALLKA